MRLKKDILEMKSAMELAYEVGNPRLQGLIEPKDTGVIVQALLWVLGEKSTLDYVAKHARIGGNNGPTSTR